MTEITLSRESVEALADALAERLRGSAPSHDFIDAAEVARRLAVSRDYVYEHADELGAIRIGNGPRARLRFDPERIAAAPSEPTPPPEPARRPRRRRTQPSVELLPVGRKGGP